MTPAGQGQGERMNEYRKAVAAKIAAGPTSPSVMTRQRTRASEWAQTWKRYQTRTVREGRREQRARAQRFLKGQRAQA